MRLRKIQTALKIKGIEYAYEESGGLGKITFLFSGCQYLVDEIKGDHDRLPGGIYTDIVGLGRCVTQKMIAEAILGMK